MRVSIHQPNVLPWIGCFAKMAQVDVWIFLDDVQYSHGQYGNRVEISGADGCGGQWLTLPVRRRLGQSFNQARLLKADTAEEGFGRLYDRYIDTPFGQEILFHVRHAWRSADIGSLADLNVKTIHLIAGIILQLHAPRFVRASRLRATSTMGEAGLVELCRAVGATTYVSGLGGQQYADKSVWAEAGITWEPMKFKHPKYDGMPREGLSIIDALCRIGPTETAERIQESIS